MRRKFNLIPFAMIIAMLLAGLAGGGCSMFKAPDDFSQEQKVEYTTLKTLQSAKVFREFALGAAGSLYKKGLMDEPTKDQIITLGDDLQQAINLAADALLAYKKAGGLGGDKALSERLTSYQAIFNQFMEIVTPYVLDVSGKEVT